MGKGGEKKKGKTMEYKELKKVRKKERKGSNPWGKKLRHFANQTLTIPRNG